MKIKKIITILGFFLMTVQFNMTSCSSGTDSDGGDGNFTATVTDPTNDYQVVGEVISVGGLGGCSIGTVATTEGVIENADFKINNAELVFESLFYIDTLFQLSYTPGTNYSLSVSHGGQTIASGTAKMPTTPTIKNLNTIRNHDLNTDMKVSWQAVQYASSIQITITGDIYDAQLGDFIERSFSSPLISADSTSFTIPDTFFTYEGEYSLGIIAYHGINPGFDVSIVEEQSGYLKSYNMNGAAGAFLAVSLSSEDGALINVGNPLAKTSPANKKSFKDYIIEKHKKDFGTYIIR